MRFCCGGLPKPPQLTKTKDILRRLRRTRSASSKRWLGHSNERVCAGASRGLSGKAKADEKNVMVAERAEAEQW